MLLERANEVHWTWLVYLEMFVAGIAAGAIVTAAMLEVSGRGRSPLARTAHLLAFPLMAFAGVLLIVDLSRPERFLHMVFMSERLLPILKPWSPMSAGTLLLSAFSGACFISFVDALVDVRRLRLGGWRYDRTIHGGPLGVAWAAISALLAFGVGIYSAVLLTTSAIPGWAHHLMIPAVYVATAIITGMAAVVLIQTMRRQIDADVLSIAHANLWLIGWWLVMVLMFVLTLVGSPSARILLTGVPLVTLVAAIVLAGVAPLVMAIVRPSGLAVRLSLSSIMVLIGGFLVRYAIVTAPQMH
jgi:formate-dependent nitrite reductase membrane component NrfD